MEQTQADPNVALTQVPPAGTVAGLSRDGQASAGADNTVPVWARHRVRRGDSAAVYEEWHD